MQRAARIHALPALYQAAAADLPTLADPGAPATPSSVPCAAWANAGFALLTSRWRTLQHITASPGKISDIARAALVLTHFEHGYLA